MNIQRDFFRLWLVLSALWLASGIWLFWDDLSGKLRPDEVAAQIKIYPLEGHILTPLDGVRIWPSSGYILICAATSSGRNFPDRSSQNSQIPLASHSADRTSHSRKKSR